MPGTAAKVRVSEKQLAVLQELSRSRTVAKGIVQRALILVLGFQGLLNEQIAVEVGLIRQQVGRLATAVAGCLGFAVCLGMHRAAPAPRSHPRSVVRRTAAGVSGKNHRRAGRADLGRGVRVAEVVGASDHPLDAQGTAGRGGQTRDRGEHLGRPGGPLLEAGGASAASLEDVAEHDGEGPRHHSSARPPRSARPISTPRARPRSTALTR